MKRTLILLVIVVMVLGLAVGASAYRLKLQVTSDTGGLGALWTGSSSTGQWGTVVSGEARFYLFPGNDYTQPTTGTAYPNGYNTLKLTAEPDAWYGQCVNVGGRSGSIDLSAYSLSTSSTYWPTGTWYLYKGIGVEGTGDAAGKLVSATGNPAYALSLVDSGVFNETTLLWSTAGIKGSFASGDYFTLSYMEAVPEPGSIIAVLTGLVGLVGLRRRSRK